MKININPPNLTPEQEKAVREALQDTAQKVLDNMASEILTRAYQPTNTASSRMKPSVSFKMPHVILGSEQVPFPPKASQLELEGEFTILD